MKATHWSVETDPEYWNENPNECPKVAVQLWLASNPDCSASETINLILGDGADRISVHGYEATRDIPKEGECIEYEPGIEWYRPTGEEIIVTAKLVLSVDPEEQP